MAIILAMIRRDVVARLRDRSAVVIGVLAPLALISVLTFISGGPDRDRLKVGFTTADATSPLSHSLRGGALKALEDDGTLRVTEYPSREAMSAAIRDGDVKSGLAVTALPAAIEVVRGADSPVSAAVLEAVAKSTAAIGDTVGRVIGVAVSRGLPPPGADAIVAALRAHPQALRIVDAGESAGGITPKAAVAAGMAAFFLFFTVQFGVLGLLEERRQGVLPRVLAAPVARWKVIAAKVGVSYVLGVLSMVSLWIAVRFLLGAKWGPPLGVGMLILTGVAAAVSTITLVAGLVRNPDQASNVQSMLALVLGLVGGAFFPIERSGGIGATLSKLTPHHWFREGLVRISGSRPWTAAAYPSAVMLVFALVVGIPGLILANRTVRP